MAGSTYATVSLTARLHQSRNASTRPQHQLLRLQRQAGNRAVAALVQRQAGPTDAGAPAGAPPQAKTASPAQDPSPTPAEAAPVTLPLTGPLAIVFSGTARQWHLDTAEIDKLKIGAGELKTAPIPAGKWLSVSAKIGAKSAAQPSASLALSPIAAEIDAKQIQDKQGTHESAGIGGAAAGGIVGGVIGGAVGGLLGPVGMAYGAKKGAELGGVEGGKAMAGAAQAFDKKFELTAKLTSGTVSGRLGLQYNPFIGLSFSATGLSWLATLDATLNTMLSLALQASASLDNSEVKLTFDGGRLVRTQFVLEPAMKFVANFDADAFLSVSARLLPFMDSDEFPDSSPLKDPDARTVELYTSQRFNLFRYEFMRQAKGKLALAKGSPLEVLETVLGVADALDMGSLLPEAITQGSRDPLPTATEPPKRGTAGAEPLESDFQCRPDDEILVRSTGQRGSRVGWYRGKVLPFERPTKGRQAGQLVLVYRVPFTDQPVTIRTDARMALEELNNPSGATTLRYFQNAVHRELLDPLLANPLLSPGPNAQGSIPASGPRTTSVERTRIQHIGDSTGCHSGAGHAKGASPWIADHQRPSGLVRHTLAPGGQVLYPQCQADSNKQSKLVADIIRMWTGRPAEKDEDGKAI